MKIILYAFMFTAMISSIHAQGIKNILNNAKSEAQRRVTEKANQKIDRATTQGIDKVLDKTLYKLFPKPTAGVFTTGNGGTVQPKISTKKSVSTNGKTNENGEIMIATNIKCAAGKSAIEKTAMATPGVSTALVDTDTGMMYLVLTGKLTSYDDIILMIRKNGFTADGKKPTGGNNPCK
ncbi:MAG: hypothetical protein ABJB86_08700 [Bacteroidota bacterium]